MMSFMTASIPIAVSTHSRVGTPSIPVMQLMHYSTKRATETKDYIETIDSKGRKTRWAKPVKK